MCFGPAGPDLAGGRREDRLDGRPLCVGHR
jgi:hypothetical protein